jgi:hypothetical protein
MRAALAALCLVVACASGSRATGAAVRARPNPNLITANEIASTDETDAFELVRKLRPQFLTSHGRTTGAPPPTPLIYVDGVYYGELPSLHAVNVRMIESISYHSLAEATTMHGRGHEGGSIDIVTRH